MARKRHTPASNCIESLEARSIEARNEAEPADSATTKIFVTKEKLMKLTKLLTSLVLIGVSTVASAVDVTQGGPAGSISLGVDKNCVINTGLAGPGAIGSVTPSFGVSGDYLSPADQASFNCTNTTPYVVDVNKQLLGLTGPGGNIPYTAKIYASGKGSNGTAAATGAQSGAGVGGGMSVAQKQTVDYKYKIVEADYLDVPPGTYADLTLALKITY
jgi:hypothetical protein